MTDTTSTLPTIRARVLIVDDHPNTGPTLARILDQLHLPVEILTAFNGPEALAKIGVGIDVLIVDYLMPGMTGLELIEQLRSLPIRQPARIILITAHHSADLVARSRQFQVDAYLVKPVHPKQIQKLVEGILQELCLESSPACSGSDPQPGLCTARLNAADLPQGNGV